MFLESVQLLDVAFVLVLDVRSGGKICLSIHFMPLWAKNVPHFGIAHALALGVSALLQFYMVACR